MTDATYWRLICDTRVTSGSPSLASDPWCRRLLSQVAGPRSVTMASEEYHPAPLGKDGTIWRFDDGSALLANSETTIVR